MKTGKLVKSIVAFLLVMIISVSLAEPVKAASPIRSGIDVSYHQGAIDWNAVKSSGVQFAFIRAGSCARDN